MAKLGFIGLGVMGSQMVNRLLSKGHSVTGYNRTRSKAQWLIDRVDELGGSVNAIEFIKSEIEESAFGYHERYRTGQDVVVGGFSQLVDQRGCPTRRR